MKFPFLKRVLFYAACLGVVAYSLRWYESSLRELLPKDMEAKAALDRVVPAHSSLLEGEELLHDAPSRREAPPASALAEGTSNLLVRLSGSVTDESGALATIAFREGTCPASTLVYGGELRAHVSQQMEESLELRLARTVCVPFQSGTAPFVQSMRGSWATSGPALPEFESAVQALIFVAPEGTRHALYLTALGYCDSEEGDCSAAVGFEKMAADDSPATSVYLAGEGEVRLGFTADAE